MRNNLKIAIIGLGYVGLPLALAFSKKFKVLGFDINKNRVLDLQKGIDKNNEFKKKDLIRNKNLLFKHNDKELNTQDIFIITAPTPLKKRNLPDLTPLISAIKIVAKKMKKNSIVIIESQFIQEQQKKFAFPL